MTDLKTAEIAGARKKAVSAAGIGNFVEWFDFGIYAQFITIIGMKFFPSDNPTASLLSGFAAFAVGFLARPIGGVIFGNIGDRVGRRAALSGAVLLMSAATVAIGLTPSYATIGLLAPVLLVAWRILQGLSAGGEYAGSSSFIIEYAPSNRRALFGSVNPVSVALGTAAGASVGLIVTQAMDTASLESWGWRIPFLIAGPVGLVGLYLRLKIQETPEFEAVKEAAREAVHPPIVRAFQDGLKPMVVLFAWSMVTAVSFYLLGGYMVAYNTEELGLERSDALTSYIVALVVFAIACPIAGLAADRWGRRPVGIVAAVGLGVVAIPSFHIMGAGGLGSAMLGQSLYAIFAGSVALVTPVLMVELFKPEIRYTASALAYNMAFALLGGTAPLVATWLIARTGDPISPAYYVVLFAAVGLVAVLVGLKGYYAKDNIRSLQMGTEADRV
ncbi:MFS transporter [Aeromicrobium choanae]|uniref:Putative proline/betaine transporter n=1 Tax=Aeromicrobium choanae TaxID=1736691 RepID=A0A1T4YQD4_9ACTN|nr:MFS transporter [Aeromicrobium choanae]SKB03936.1 MFS transporter, MHS family, proline/betaine transporter [Aeromicrobium choanae]